MAFVVSGAVDDLGEGERRRTASRRAKLLSFIVLSAAVIVVLSLLGFPPILILGVFSLAILLGVFAVVIIIVLGGRQRIRW